MAIKTLKVYRCGTKIELGKFEAKVVGVQIRENDMVMYEVAWMDGRRRYIEWVFASEVKPIDEVSKTTRIGFVMEGHECTTS
jgi:hypothetical protein